MKLVILLSVLLIVASVVVADHDMKIGEMCMYDRDCMTDNCEKDCTMGAGVGRGMCAPSLGVAGRHKKNGEMCLMDRECESNNCETDCSLPGPDRAGRCEAD